MTIDHGLEIQGPGASAITIDANDKNAVFVIEASENVDVAISGLTLTHGNAQHWQY